MHGRLRWPLALCLAAPLAACGHQDTLRSSVETAVRRQIGAAARPHVGYVYDSTGILIDFEATALPDTTQATFERIARDAAAVAVRQIAWAALDSVVVSAGQTLRPGVFRVLRARTFKATEFR
jgi:hypothetical protein